jgi:8-oxo-dGTP pyrophosphatase MutT (NUDIX family)
MIKIVHGLYLSCIRTDRASAVPYTIYDNQLYFLFGKDKKSGDITDFGGGVKKHEYSLSAGLREFHEETNEIFMDKYGSVNDHVLDIAVYSENKKFSTLFIPVSNIWLIDASEHFDEKKIIPKCKTHDEISDMIWIPESELENLIQKSLWKRLKNFYMNICENEILFKILKTFFIEKYQTHSEFKKLYKDIPNSRKQEFGTKSQSDLYIPGARISARGNSLVERSSDNVDFSVSFHPQLESI